METERVSELFPANSLAFAKNRTLIVLVSIELIQHGFSYYCCPAENFSATILIAHGLSEYDVDISIFSP